MIVIKYNSMKNINSLTISDNENLKTIEIENGLEDPSNDDVFGSCMNIKTVIISSTLIIR